MTAVCTVCNTTPGVPHERQDSDCLFGPHHGNPHPPARVGWLCSACVERWRSWLTEITELWAGLETVVPLGSVPDDTARHAHTKRDGSPAMMRLDAWAMLHDRDRLQDRVVDPADGRMVDVHGEPGTLPDVPDLLGYWCERVADEVHGVGAPNGRSTVSGACVYLSSQSEAVAGSPLVDEFDAELRWLRRCLMQAHGRTEPKAICRCITVTDGRDCPGRVWRPEHKPELAKLGRGGDTRPVCDRCHRRYGPGDLAKARVTEAMNSENEPDRQKLRSASEGTGKA